jgi:hypothetical protein
MKGFLSPNIMLELYDLFQKRGWEINEQTDAKKSLYRRYSERLKYLGEEEQKLFINLSYRFEQIGIKDYLEFFLMSLHNMEDSKLTSVDKIIFTPLSKPFVPNSGNGKKIVKPKTKSSQFLFAYIDRHDLRWLDYSDKFEFVESINDVKKMFTSNKTLLVLVDDFVGTGKTAVTCINNIKDEIQKENKIDNGDICIISIAALSEGVQKVKNDLGIKVYSDIIRNKGITDYFPTDIVSQKKLLMLEIERKLKCPPQYSFGFGQSEALITFGDKTPNNTFPAYWYETAKKIAPFPRYKNYK